MLSFCPKKRRNEKIRQVHVSLWDGRTAHATRLSDSFSAESRSERDRINLLDKWLISISNNDVLFRRVFVATPTATDSHRVPCMETVQINSCKIRRANGSNRNRIFSSRFFFLPQKLSTDPGRTNHPIGVGANTTGIEKITRTIWLLAKCRW